MAPADVLKIECMMWTVRRLGNLSKNVSRIWIWQFEVVDDDKQVASGKMEKSIGKGFLASLFQNSHKLFQAAVQDVDSEYEGEVGMVQVLFDVHKKVPTAYQWGKDDKPGCRFL
jgi:hypothetical protein